MNPKEIKRVTLDQLRAGIQVRTGHRVVFVVTGRKRVSSDIVRMRWGAPLLRHGAQAEMIVDVRGNESAELIFEVEQRLEGSWVKIGEARGRVEGSVARASVPAQHPHAAGSRRERAPVPMRFHAHFA